MENKINVAELLKDCPIGMELDCTMYDNCTFEGIEDFGYIDILINTPSGRIRLTKEGCYIRHDDNAKCVIFPKGKTTWEGFMPPLPSCQFNDGDVIVDKYGAVSIYKRVHSSYEEPYVDFHCGITSRSRSFYLKDSDSLQHCGEISSIRLATEEEKQELFQAIKENGYCWNAETKTLEKLIESKEDTEDKAVMSGIYFDREYYADEVELHLNNYEIEIRDGKTYAIFKTKTLEKPVKPIFRVGDTIRNKVDNWLSKRTIKSFTEGIGYFTTINDWIRINEQDEWELVPNPNKFDITTLKPFDSRVLVRDDNCYEWEADIFGRYSDGYITLGGGKWKQCIPYKHNEHLFGTTNDCDDFYKTWEK